MPRNSGQNQRKTKALAHLYPTGYTGGMMSKQFCILFSPFTGRSTVHAADCRCVKKAASQRQPGEMVQASAPEEAAMAYSEKHLLSERGWPEPSICRCAK